MLFKFPVNLLFQLSFFDKGLTFVLLLFFAVPTDISSVTRGIISPGVDFPLHVPPVKFLCYFVYKVKLKVRFCVSESRIRIFFYFLIDKNTRSMCYKDYIVTASVPQRSQLGPFVLKLYIVKQVYLCSRNSVLTSLLLNARYSLGHQNSFDLKLSSTMMWTCLNIIFRIFLSNTSGLNQKQVIQNYTQFWNLLLTTFLTLFVYKGLI